MSQLENEEEESYAGEADMEYEQDIHSESLELVKALNIDQWVAVWYDGNWYPGSVQQVRTLLYYCPLIYMLQGKLTYEYFVSTEL